jgi:hypothetical protein
MAALDYHLLLQDKWFIMAAVAAVAILVTKAALLVAAELAAVAQEEHLLMDLELQVLTVLEVAVAQQDLEQIVAVLAEVAL